MNKEKKVTMKEVHENRRQGTKVYGITIGYCESIGCCDYCNRRVRFWCKVDNFIEARKRSIIKKICK